MAIPLAQAEQDESARMQQRIQTLEQERRHLLAVIEILQEVAGSLHFVDIVQAVARRLGETFGLDRSSIFLADRGGQTVRLVASYEDPSIRNYVVDVDRYPELKRALQTNETVFIADWADDPALRSARGTLLSRRVKTITIFLRTFRDGPTFSEADIQFCKVVANLTAKALRNAHRFERLQERHGDESAGRAQDRERAALLGYMRRLLDAFGEKQGPWQESVLSRASSAEIERLVGVTMTVLAQEATGR
jgi:GAF domain-containing protein